MQCIKTLVFERTQQFREVGSGLILAGNAIKALHQMGLADVLHNERMPWYNGPGIRDESRTGNFPGKFPVRDIILRMTPPRLLLKQSAWIMDNQIG